MNGKKSASTPSEKITPEEPVATAPDLTGFEAKLRSGGSFSVTYKTGQSISMSRISKPFSCT